VCAGIKLGDVCDETKADECKAKTWCDDKQKICRKWKNLQNMRNFYHTFDLLSKQAVI